MCCSPKQVWAVQRPSPACDSESHHPHEKGKDRVVWHRVPFALGLFPNFLPCDVPNIWGQCCPGQGGIRQGVKVRVGGSGRSWQETSICPITMWLSCHSPALPPRSLLLCQLLENQRPFSALLAVLSLAWGHCCPFSHQLRKCPEGVPLYIYF